VIDADGLLLDLGRGGLDRRTGAGWVAETLRVLRSHGLPLLFLTTDPRGSREQYAARLAAGGVPAGPTRCSPAPGAAAQLVDAVLALPLDVAAPASPRSRRSWNRS